jgi:hypothetical protein
MHWKHTAPLTVIIQQLMKLVIQAQSLDHILLLTGQMMRQKVLRMSMNLMVQIIVY